MFMLCFYVSDRASIQRGAYFLCSCYVSPRWVLAQLDTQYSTWGMSLCARLCQYSTWGMSLCARLCQYSTWGMSLCARLCQYSTWSSRRVSLCTCCIVCMYLMLMIRGFECVRHVFDCVSTHRALSAGVSMYTCLFVLYVICICMYIFAVLIVRCLRVSVCTHVCSFCMLYAYVCIFVHVCIFAITSGLIYSCRLRAMYAMPHGWRSTADWLLNKDVCACVFSCGWGIDLPLQAWSYPLDWRYMYTYIHTYTYTCVCV
jgi:hypothetical protein